MEGGTSGGEQRSGGARRSGWRRNCGGVIFHERRIYFKKNDKIVKMVEELLKCGTVT